MTNHDIILSQLAGALHSLAQTLEECGDPKALAYATEAVAICRRLPPDPCTQLRLAGMLITQGRISAHGGVTSSSVAMQEEAVSLLRGLVKSGDPEKASE